MIPCKKQWLWEFTFVGTLTANHLPPWNSVQGWVKIGEVMFCWLKSSTWFCTFQVHFSHQHWFFAGFLVEKITPTCFSCYIGSTSQKHGIVDVMCIAITTAIDSFPTFEGLDEFMKWRKAMMILWRGEWALLPCPLTPMCLAQESLSTISHISRLCLKISSQHSWNVSILQSWKE